MKTFTEILLEATSNKITRKVDKNNRVTLDQFVRRDTFKHQFGAPEKLKHSSISGQHDIYIAKSTTDDHPNDRQHLWVHKNTGHVDMQILTNVVPGKKKNEEIHSKIDLIGTHGGPKIAHHAYYDLMRGVTGKHAVLVHNNQSPGAVKVRRKIRKTYPDVLYHTHNPHSGAKHLTHGVSVSNLSPGGIHAAHRETNIVGFIPPENRKKLK